MYIAMNNFRVHADRCEDFERVWRERESYLDGVAGFEQLLLLKGPKDDSIQQYASHSVWQDEASFRAWLASDAFKKAHSGRPSGALASPPQFVGWTSVPMTD
jgi:heme-degrading monooxygenase HmoA